MATPASQEIPILSDNTVEQKLRIDVGQSLWSIALRRFRRDYLSVTALVVLVIIAIACYSAPLIGHALGLDPDAQVLDPSDPSGATYLTYAPVGTPGHILGTDDLAHDEFIRLLYGGQVSLAIGFFAGVFSVTIGVSLGVFTGFSGGWIDDVFNWFITTLDSIPSLYLLLLVTVIVNASTNSQFIKHSVLADIPRPVTLIGILSILSWTGIMRLVRGETLSIREREYVLAARSVGASNLRIMFTHILPNVFSVILVTLMLNIGSLILTEAALSFLGFGIDPNVIPTWGNMLTNAESYYTLGAHLLFVPGILITVTVLCLFILGDGLRDAFDPKLKERA